MEAYYFHIMFFVHIMSHYIMMIKKAECEVKLGFYSNHFPAMSPWVS